MGRGARTRTGTAHPRWRGEHASTLMHIAPVSGSSPLARGAPAVHHDGLVRPGLIPAGAGSTLFTWATSRVVGAHPRWRGEHPARLLRMESPGGSSPLARGAPFGIGEALGPVGLIPAGAGSTEHWVRDARPGAAHPRWRGEHCMRSLPMVTSAGSSPLARGALRGEETHHVQPGLIPAGAGSTGDGERVGRGCRAHPRWRGEHRTKRPMLALPLGSSPLARGALDLLFGISDGGGLIPAGAGSTAPTKRRPPRLRAHPRWRGEHHN